MDRLTTYFGAVPLNSDLLFAQQYAMTALAKLSYGVLGMTNIVNNFTVTPTTPASLAIVLGMGEIYQAENLEATQWSNLQPNSETILKQGILHAPVTIGINPPSTGGFSQVYLIEVGYADSDTGSVVLPYYNSATPSSPFQGPGGSGFSNNTTRLGTVVYQAKAGIAAATGTQVAPSADAGYVGIYTVTVANGQSTITSGNISIIGTAPFIPVTLPNVPAGVQFNKWTYNNDTGTSGAFVTSITPAPSAYAAGLEVIIKAANPSPGASTVNVMGANGTLLGAVALQHHDGSALAANEITTGTVFCAIHDGTKFQLAWASAAPTGGTVSPTIAAHGQCYLQLTGGNLQLLPKDGDALIINGVQQAIQSAGSTLAATGLTPNTFYYIYATWTGSAVALVASTTTHSTNSSTGVETMAGDATKTLVGAAYCVTGPAWSDVDGGRYVLSWFNRREKRSQSQFSAQRSINVQTSTEVNSEIRSNFICWANDDVLFYFGAAIFVTGAANVGSCGISFDGNAPEPEAAFTGAGTGTTVYGNGCLSGCKSGLSEGVAHYATVMGSTSVNTTTLVFWYNGGGWTVSIPTMQCVIKG